MSIVAYSCRFARRRLNGFHASDSRDPRSRPVTPRHIGPETPHIGALARCGALRPLSTVTPAVTCTVQATFMTGALPREHGIVANGWLFRDLMEVWLWRQSNRLVAGEKIWEAGRRRDPAFTTANLFWWYNMAATHDIGVTPRPIYRSDGRKLPDCYTKPLELRDELTARLGAFPLFNFWGPATSIAASRWIAGAALHVRHTRSPTLTLVYLPHLDYDLQRLGPDDPRIPASLREIDAVCRRADRGCERDGARVIILSEYGITPVSTPVHINRALRQAGLLQVRREGDGELLDPIQSSAFAVSDHQIAHVYVANAIWSRRCAASSGRYQAWNACSIALSKARLPSTIRARANSSHSRVQMPGSPIITGSMIAVRRILPAWSKSTASPDTIRSSCFSIRPFAFRNLRSDGGSPSGPWVSPR